ncbi:unnamed protein product, partial [Prorocentrum cordatum]
ERQRATAPGARAAPPSGAPGPRAMRRREGGCPLPPWGRIAGAGALIVLRAAAEPRAAAGLPDCGGAQDWASYPWALATKLHAGWHNAAGQLKLRMGRTESSIDSFQACVDIDPCAAHAQYQLATLLYEHGNLNRSELHFELAVNADPNQHFARLRLSALRQLRAQATFWSHLDVAQKTRPDLNASEHWAHMRSKDASPYHAQCAEVLRQWPPVQLAMNSPPVITEDLAGILEKERRVFKTACRAIPARLSKRLPGALAAVRRQENSSEWMVPWAVNRLRHFGGLANGTVGLLHTIWFQGWQEVASSPAVAAALEDESLDEILAIVVGSGLGSTCLFALALGATRCIGYDVLCEGLVEPARGIVEEHDLSGGEVEFRCGDARRMKELPEATLVFVNDHSLPEQIRGDFQKLMARDLRNGAVALSTTELRSPETAGLQVVGGMRVMASWAFSVPVYVLQSAGGRGPNAGKGRSRPTRREL